MITKRSFVYHVGVLASGNLLAVGISVVAVPVLTRLYPAEDYGVFGMVMAVLAIVVPVSTLRLDAAVVLPKSNVAASALYAVGLRILSIFAGAFALALVFVPPNLLPAALRWIPDSPAFVAIIVGVLLAQAYSLMAGNWLLRNGYFKQISVSRVGEALFEKLSAVVLGLFFPGGWGLMIGRLVGSVALATLSWSFLKPIRPQMASRDDQKRHLHEYRGHIKHAPVTVILGQVSQWVPVVLAGGIFTSAVAGFFFLSRQLVAMPLNSIGRAIQRALLREAAGDPHSAGVQWKCSQLIIMSIPALCIMSSSLFLFGPEVIDAIMGPDWIGFGEYTAILSIGYGASFVHLSMSGLFDALQAHDKRIALDAILLFLRLGVFAPALMLGWSPQATFLSFSLVTAGIYLSGVIQLLRLIRMRPSVIRRLVAIFVVAPILTCVLSVSFAVAQDSLVADLATLAILAAANGALVLYGFQRELVQGR